MMTKRLVATQTAQPILILSALGLRCGAATTPAAAVVDPLHLRPIRAAVKSAKPLMTSAFHPSEDQNRFSIL
jgi:hypothetical protein